MRGLEQVAGALELVLVGERGGGVDAVDNSFRTVAVEDLEHEAASQHVVGQVAEHVLDDESAMGPVGQEGGPVEPRHRSR